MDSEYQPISQVERLLTVHPWLLEAQAWKLLRIKYVLMGPELTIHNPDHLQLIMQYSNSQPRPQRLDAPDTYWLDLQDSLNRWGGSKTWQQLQQLGQIAKTD